MSEFMDNLLKFIGGIGGIVVIVSAVIYSLATIFAPLGVVWLVLNH